MNYFTSNDGGILAENNPPIEKIYDLLYQLGIIANCSGFFYTAFSVWLAVREPKRLTLVTKWLYLDVARHYDSSVDAVGKGISRVITEAWDNKPELLSNWARYALTEKPKPSEFIAILAAKITDDQSR